MDITIKYKDKAFKCNGAFTANDCKKDPFTEEFRENLKAFAKELGTITSVTVKL